MTSETLPAELRLKVLELAREILHNAYVDLKAQRHNEWAARAEVAWRTQGLRLPYPGFPPYFSEQDVVAKAQHLLQFVSGTDSNRHTDSAPIENTVKENIVAEEVVSPEPIVENAIETVADPQPTVNLPAEILAPSENTVAKPLKVFGNWRRS